MKLLYVDDEKPAVARFKATAAKLTGVDSITAFTTSAGALEYAEANPVDVAFLDIEMPEINGIDLGKRLNAINPDIRLVYVTAYDNYALEAFGADAIAYLLKPYTAEQLQKAVDKAQRIMPVPHKKVYIKTIPNFDVYVDGVLFPINGAKPKELLAVLVDRNGGAVTSGQIISLLWEDRDSDKKTQALYRMTVKRLKEILEDGGIDFIIGSDGHQRFVKPDVLECDYFKLIAGDKDMIDNYDGIYMSEYSWAEDTNARLSRMFGLC